MNDSLNNKELVAAGHEFAKALSSDTAIIDIAKMLSRLAERLDCTTAVLRETKKQRDALAAENAALKDWNPNPYSASMFEAIEKAEQLMDDGMPELAMVEAFETLKLKRTPASDAYLAEVRAQSRKEGAHFVANRMLAAWEAGFIEDTAKNAADIARMILTSTEFMADAPEGDFDRSFADGVLEDIVAQLRQGGAA